MAGEYPESTVWYVEAQSRNGDHISVGSAVVVCLRKKKGDGTQRRYLLTCTHVIRGVVEGSRADDKEAGFGPVLENIFVWEPETGLTKSLSARVSEIKRIPRGSIPLRERVPADDWVILEVEDEVFSRSAEYVKSWGKASSGEFSIIGYPDGRSAFHDHIVKSTPADVTFRDNFERVLRFHGDETRPGMSGGAVMGSDDRFVGIHRMRRDRIRQCHAVSAEFVRDELAARYNYEVVAAPAASTVSEVSELRRQLFQTVNGRELTRLKRKVESLLGREPENFDAEELLDDVNKAIAALPPPRPLALRWAVSAAVVLLLASSIYLSGVFITGGPTPAKPYSGELIDGLQLADLRPPDSDPAEARENSEPQGNIRFSSGKYSHMALKVSGGTEFVLKSYSFKGTVKGDLLAVQDGLFAAVASFDEKSSREFEQRQGLVFPPASQVVIRSQSGGGTLEYRLVGYMRPASVSATRITVRANEIVFRENGQIAELVPLEGAQVSIHPSNFDASQVEGGTTDAEGRAKIAIHHSPLPADSKPRVHFLVKPPDRLKDKAPLVTTENGAAEFGRELRLLEKRPRQISDGESLDLKVISYADAGRFYALQIPAALSRIMEAGSGEGDLSASLTQVGRDLDLEPRILESAAIEWAKRLTAERPAIAVDDESLLHTTQVVRETASRVAPSVCYVVNKRLHGESWAGTGFVIADDLVLVASFDKDDEFKFVGFGPLAGDPKGTALPVAETLLRLPKYEVAVLRVPGIRAPKLGLCAKNPYADGFRGKVAVIGYVSDDALLPPEVRQAFTPGGSNRKRIMPGELLGSDELVVIRDNATLQHDATTGGGAAGAPVIDLTTGLVMGIHMAGRWSGTRKSNGAVPMWGLLEEKSFAELLKEHDAVLKTQLEIDLARLSAELKKALLPALTGKKIEPPDFLERHREEIRIGPIPVVTYWWSSIGGTVQTNDLENRLIASISISEQSAERVVGKVSVSIPLTGRATGKALADGSRLELLSVTSNFSTTMNAEVGCRVEFKPDNSAELKSIEIDRWTVVLQDTRFDNPLADKLRGPIESYVNDKLRIEAQKLLEQAREELRKAIMEGRINLAK